MKLNPHAAAFQPSTAPKQSNVLEVDQTENLQEGEQLNDLLKQTSLTEQSEEGNQESKARRPRRQRKPLEESENKADDHPSSIPTSTSNLDDTPDHVRTPVARILWQLSQQRRAGALLEDEWLTLKYHFLTLYAALNVVAVLSSYELSPTYKTVHVLRGFSLCDKFGVHSSIRLSVCRCLLVEGSSHALDLLLSHHPELQPHISSPLPKRALKLLYVLRGVSGCGKSTLSDHIGVEGGVFSADHFFLDTNGRYMWDPSRLEDAHRTALQKAVLAMHRGLSPVVVDNTHVRMWEARSYVAAGVKYGYKIVFLEPDTPWRKDAATLAHKNKHGVPLDKIENMLENWEDGWTVEAVMKAQRAHKAQMVKNWRQGQAIEKPEPKEGKEAKEVEVKESHAKDDDGFQQIKRKGKGKGGKTNRRKESPSRSRSPPQRGVAVNQNPFALFADDPASRSPSPSPTRTSKANSKKKSQKKKGTSADSREPGPADLSEPSETIVSTATTREAEDSGKRRQRKQRHAQGKNPLESRGEQNGPGTQGSPVAVGTSVEESQQATQTNADASADGSCSVH